MTSIPEEPRDFEEMLIWLNRMDYTVFDRQWVAVVTDLLIRELGDDPRTEWVDKVLQPIMWLVRTRYREEYDPSMNMLKEHRFAINSRIEGIKKKRNQVKLSPCQLRLCEILPDVGDKILTTDIDPKERVAMRRSAKRCCLFKVVNGAPKNPGHIERVRLDF